MPDMSQLEIDGVIYDVRDPTKAPSGYGLGEDISAPIGLDSVTKSGNYKGSMSLPGMSVAVTVWCRADMSSPNYGTQHLYSELHGGVEFFRTKNNGIWGELECVNPPMAVGVEYRTAERRNGKVVYTKLVSVGALAASGSVTCKLNTSSATIVGFDAIGYTSSGSYIKFPRVDKDGNITARIWVQNDEVWIGCIDDNTDVTSCYVTVRYTKD